MNQIPIPSNHFIQSLVNKGKMTQSIQSAQNQHQNNQYLGQNVGPVFYQLNPNIIKAQSMEDTDQPTQSTNITKTIMNRINVMIEQQEQKKKEKQKSLQLQRLNSLRKQYQSIRKMQIKRHQKLKFNSNSPNKSPSSCQQSSKSDIYAKNRHSISHHKQRERERERERERDRDYRLLQHQKKQLEIILSRNMNRLEQMIRNQMEYKRKIFELTKKNPKQQYETNSLIDRLKSSEKKLQCEIDELKECLQKQVNKIRILQGKYEQLEKKNLNLQTQLRSVKEQRRKVEQKKFLLAQAELTNKIHIKCLIMQKQMIIKQKQAESENLNKTIRTMREEMREERQNLLNKIDQKHSQCQQLQKKYSLSQQQIKQLKTQLKKMQQHRIIKGQDKHELQLRVQILQKKVQQQNSQKSAFFIELKKVIKDFQQLDNQNIALRSKLRISQIQRIRLSSQKSIECDLSAIQISKRNANSQIKHIKSQIKYKSSEQTQKQKNILEQKISVLQAELQTLKQKSRQYEKKEEEFLEQKQKMRIKYDLSLQMAHKKYQAEIEILNNYKNRLLNEVNQEKIKILSIKHLIPFQVQSMRNQHDDNIAVIRQRYEKQLKILKINLHTLQRQNQLFTYQNSVLMNDRIQKYQLTEKVKNMISLRQKVDHLWYIKQVQYTNLNGILNQMREGDKSSIIQKLDP